MIRRALLAVLPLLTGLLLASPALADTQAYVVSGLGGPGGAPCAPEPNVPTAFTCDSLRAAIAAANANPGEDVVYLPTSGTYQLSQGQLLISGSLVILGQNARVATLAAAPASRALSINGGIDVSLDGLTISGGSP